MTDVDLLDVRELMPIDDPVEAFSGAALFRGVLTDGRRVVLKRPAPEGDWLERATDGRGRLSRLWSDGTLDAVDEVVDHTILAVRDEPGGTSVVMRDASSDLLPGGTAIGADVSDSLLRGLADLHRRFEGAQIDGLCDIGARYAMFSPRRHQTDEGTGAHPLAARIVAGWQLFAKSTPDDVVAAIDAVHHDPDRLGRRLRSFTPTLLHGDAKPENLGLAGPRLVAIDWGDLTGCGPPEIDVGWFALKASERTARDLDATAASYARVSGRVLRREALDLVAIGCLAQMGFRFALGAQGLGLDDPQASQAQLDRWIARVRAAISRVGPL